MFHNWYTDESKLRRCKRCKKLYRKDREEEECVREVTTRHERFWYMT